MVVKKIKADINLVKQVGDRIGYGHLMSLASALWRKKLRESGTSESGAFYPIIRFFIQDKYNKITEDEIKYYDKIIEENCEK